MGAKLHSDGSVEYTAPYGLTDITLNGESVLAMEPIEIRIWPDGWGYVCMLKEPPDGTWKLQVDGLRRTYTRHGRIVITP